MLTPKNIILNRKWLSKHLISGQNTQQLELKKQDTVCSNVRTTNLIHKGNTQIEITI